MEMMVEKILLVDKVILDLVVEVLEVLESTGDILVNLVLIIMELEMVEMDNH
jgi:hypothetical protein|tara:strand:- start:130 stop:285 length:156 start_codon:yes stop_codon:yes gene_type:complete